MLEIIYLVSKVSYIRNTPSEEEEEQKRLIKEVSLMAKLQHPNIVRCLGATQQPRCFNIFLEWMAGSTHPLFKSFCLNYKIVYEYPVSIISLTFILHVKAVGILFLYPLNVRCSVSFT